MNLNKKSNLNPEINIRVIVVPGRGPASPVVTRHGVCQHEVLHISPLNVLPTGTLLMPVTGTVFPPWPGRASTVSRGRGRGQPESVRLTRMPVADSSDSKSLTKPTTWAGKYQLGNPSHKLRHHRSPGRTQSDALSLRLAIEVITKFNLAWQWGYLSPGGPGAWQQLRLEVCATPSHGGNRLGGPGAA